MNPDFLNTDESLFLANVLIHIKGPVVLRCDYINWRGETAKRTFMPKSFEYRYSEFHETEALLLIADDLEKNAEREFLVRDFDTSTLEVIGQASG